MRAPSCRRPPAAGEGVVYASRERAPHRPERGRQIALDQLGIDAEDPHAVKPRELRIAPSIARASLATRVNAAVDFDHEPTRSDEEIGDVRVQRM